jgi:hypothetical protein
VGGAEEPRADVGVRIDVGENLEGKIIRRAWQIMRGEAWVKDAPAEARPLDSAGMEELPSDALVSLDEGSVAELVMDETTEPRFVIIEQKR